MSTARNTGPTLPTSNVTQDYLKAIYSAVEWGGPAMSVSALATRMGVSASTASETVRRLADEGLVHHERYGGISRTERGREAALKMVRRHRLIETLLVEHLGYEWDEVHDEAEVLEHAVSDEFVERLAARLGHPERDPHGDPIPARDGTVPAVHAVRLSALEEGRTGVVARVSDTEPELLRYFAEVGIVLDAPVRVVARRDVVGTMDVEVASTVVALGLAAADAAWVVVDG